MSSRRATILEQAARRGRGIDFTRLAVAEAELQVKDLLVEVLNKLAEVEANQDEIDEWRGRAERLLTDQRRPW